MRPFADLFSADLHEAVNVSGQQEVAELPAAVGVRPLSDDQEAAVLAKGHTLIDAGDAAAAGDAHRAFFWLEAAHCLDDRGEVLRGRAATSADHIHAVLDDKLAEPFGQFIRRQRVMRLAGDKLRQPRIRYATEQPRRATAEETNVLGHLLRAGRAIHPDD